MDNIYIHVLFWFSCSSCMSKFIIFQNDLRVVHQQFSFIPPSPTFKWMCFFMSKKIICLECYFTFFCCCCFPFCLISKNENCFLQSWLVSQLLWSIKSHFNSSFWIKSRVRRSFEYLWWFQEGINVF